MSQRACQVAAPDDDAFGVGRTFMRTNIANRHKRKTHAEQIHQYAGEIADMGGSGEIGCPEGIGETIVDVFIGASGALGHTNVLGPAFLFDGLEPAGSDTLQWHTLADVELGMTGIGDQTVAYAEFTLDDGGPGDDTGVDGQIVASPGGLARVTPEIK